MRLSGKQKLLILLMALFLCMAGAAAAEITTGTFTADETLRAITIFPSVTKIESEAFAGCANIQLVKCLSRDVEIEEDAFDGCEGMIILCYHDSTIQRYAAEHGIPVQFIDAYEVNCNTENNGCVGLPITWMVENVHPDDSEVAECNYEVLCDDKVMDEGTLPTNLCYAFTPQTEGTYTFRVTLKTDMIQTTIASSSVPVAPKLLMGIYEQDGNTATLDPLEWRVIGLNGDKALVITENIIRVNSYFNPWWIKFKYTYWSTSYVGKISDNYRGSGSVETSFHYYNITPTSVPLEESRYARGVEADLYPKHARYWLNDVFYYDAFTDEERERILLTHNTNEDNPKSNVAGGPDSDDHVFFLSYNELLTYMPEKEDRIVSMTPVAKKELGSNNEKLWWLRSPGGYRVNAMFVYSTNGSVSLSGTDVGHSNVGYRPAMWITIGG